MLQAATGLLLICWDSTLRNSNPEKFHRGWQTLLGFCKFFFFFCKLLTITLCILLFCNPLSTLCGLQGLSFLSVWMCVGRHLFFCYYFTSKHLIWKHVGVFFFHYLKHELQLLDKAIPDTSLTLIAYPAHQSIINVALPQKVPLSWCKPHRHPLTMSYQPFLLSFYKYKYK